LKLRVREQLTQMPQTSLLSKAIAIAAVAHEHQLDKVGAPYILHPLRMMAKAQTDDERIVAILHDVVEDTEWTPGLLSEQGFPDHLLEALAGVTNREGESYSEFIERAAQNPISAKVKLLDLEENMTLTRLPQLTDKDLRRLKKYHDAYARLKELIAEPSLLDSTITETTS